MDCPCPALDALQTACSTLEQALALKDDELASLRTQLVRIKISSRSGELWSANDIALHLGVGVYAVWQRKHRDPSFPKPVNARPLMWDKSDVLSYVERKKKGA